MSIRSRVFALCVLMFVGIHAGVVSRPHDRSATAGSPLATHSFLWPSPNPADDRRPGPEDWSRNGALACFVPWRSSVKSGDAHPLMLMLRCAVTRWPVPGGLDKAISVVACESSWNPLTVNEGGTHFGLFQHDKRYWRQRWRDWGKALDTPNNPLDAWASIIVSVRIINRYGWSAWSCA
jgi:hypothetical protein